LSSDRTKRIGHLAKPPWANKPKRRTNKELEKRILTILGIHAMSNPYTNSRGTITPLQISKQVPDLMLRSFDDIQNTMYNMVEKELLHKVEETFGTVKVRIGESSSKAEEEETKFQISGKGIVQFRKSIRPIARLAINNEKKYQAIIDKTEGDPEVKTELKKVPEEIKQSVEGYSMVKLGLRRIPKRLMEKIEDKGYDIVAGKVARLGVNAGIFLTKLILKGNGDLDFLDS
jgi:hypothetical protein